MTDERKEFNVFVAPAGTRSDSDTDVDGEGWCLVGRGGVVYFKTAVLPGESVATDLEIGDPARLLAFMKPGLCVALDVIPVTRSAPLLHFDSICLSDFTLDLSAGTCMATWHTEKSR